MSKKQQAKKNLVLTDKITKYLVSNPNELKNFPKEFTIIPVSVNDKNFNKMNTELIEGLKNKGEHVITAKETKNKAKPWQFVFA